MWSETKVMIRKAKAQATKNDTTHLQHLQAARNESDLSVSFSTPMSNTQIAHANFKRA
jgi:hypothetical protein